MLKSINLSGLTVSKACVNHIIWNSICIVERKYQDPFEMFPIPTQNAKSTKDKFFLLKQGSGSPSTNITKMQICVASSLTGLQRKGFHQLNSSIFCLSKNTLSMKVVSLPKNVDKLFLSESSMLNEDDPFPLIRKRTTKGICATSIPTLAKPANKINLHNSNYSLPPPCKVFVLYH